MVDFSYFDSLVSLTDYFVDEHTCKVFLAEQRWGDVVVCPYCGSVHIYTCKNETMMKLQTQMKEQTEAHMKQFQEFSQNLKKMQETNSELNKNIASLTTQNAQAAKELREAKEAQHKLEQRLQEGSGDKSKLVIAVVVAIIAIVAFLIK